ncbi:MAG: hypothetical protein K6F37_09175 [Lachnospiraceae bacterium]|nr:hypothetical protein [Lachnospiraceae bacterium]
MKHVIYGGCLLILSALFLVMITTVAKSFIRGREVSDALSNALYATAMKMDAKANDEPASKEEWIATFLNSIASETDDNSNLYIEINAVDEKKGLMTVTAREEYTYSNGKTGVKEARRTVIIDRNRDELMTTYKLSFVAKIPKAEGWKNQTMVEYSLCEGTEFMLFDFPEIEGYILERVCYENGDDVIVESGSASGNDAMGAYVIDSSCERKKIDGDIVIYGIYKTK